MIFQAMTITFLVKQLWFWLVGSFVTFGLFFYFYNKSNNSNGKTNSMPVLVTSFFGIVLTFSSIWYFGIHTQPTAMSKTKDVATQAKTKFQEWQEKRRQNKENKESNSGFKFPKFRTKKQEPVDLTEFTKEFNNALGKLEDCGRKLKANDTILDGLIGKTVKQLEELAEKQKNVEKAKEVVAAAKRRIEEEIEKLKGKIAETTTKKEGYEGQKKTAEEKQTQANQEKVKTEEEIAKETSEAIKTQLNAKLKEITEEIRKLNQEVINCNDAITQCDVELTNLNYNLRLAEQALKKTEKDEKDLSDDRKQLINDQFDLSAVLERLENLKIENKAKKTAIDAEIEKLLVLEHFVNSNIQQAVQIQTSDHTTTLANTTTNVVDKITTLFNPPKLCVDAFDQFVKIAGDWTGNKSLSQTILEQKEELARQDEINTQITAKEARDAFIAKVGDDYLYLFNPKTFQPKPITQQQVNNLKDVFKRHTEYLEKAIVNLAAEVKDCQDQSQRITEKKDPEANACKSYYSNLKRSDQNDITSWQTQVNQKNAEKSVLETKRDKNPGLIAQLRAQWNLIATLLKQKTITQEQFEELKQTLEAMSLDIEAGYLDLDAAIAGINNALATFIKLNAVTAK